METYLVRHHRLPKSLGGTNRKENISFLPYCCHVAWHIIVKNWDIHRIVKELNSKYIDPEFELIVRRRQ